MWVPFAASWSRLTLFSRPPEQLTYGPLSGERSSKDWDGSQPAAVTTTYRNASLNRSKGKVLGPLSLLMDVLTIPAPSGASRPCLDLPSRPCLVVPALSQMATVWLRAPGCKLGLPGDICDVLLLRSGTSLALVLIQRDVMTT